MSQTYIYVLLGGVYGPDGAADSRGMLALAQRLSIYGIVKTHFWSDVDSNVTLAEIKTLPPDARLIFVGYSGGASRATKLANQIYPRKVKLIVGYDPSPRWQVQRLRENVERAITYHNNAPMMPSFFGWLGGGSMVGAKSTETYEIKHGVGEQHLAVDYDEDLHQRTLTAVKAATAATA